MRSCVISFASNSRVVHASVKFKLRCTICSYAWMHCIAIVENIDKLGVRKNFTSKILTNCISLVNANSHWKHGKILTNS